MIAFSRSLLAGLAVAVALPLPAQNARPDTTRIPFDAAVRVGRLPNGLRYYIRKNPRPEKRVELRLVVNAGSVQEDNDQRGLAHYVEHMLFNGTRRFQKNDIVKYLESIGVRFGADLNASTGFDETIYILPVPTDKPGLVERAFDILEDWAGAASFDSAEVVRERGVVLEEWRGGLGAESRIRDKQIPVIFRGSRYAERLPIGLPEIIEKANPEPLRRFYRDWYRPDLMAVVAVGDIDPAQIERLITERFGRLAALATARPRIEAPVPGNDSTLISIATDPEEQVATVYVMYKHPPTRMQTVGDYRRSMLEQLHHFMFNDRLTELSRKSDAPFSLASSGYGGFVRGTDIYQLVAVAKDVGNALPSLQAVLTEAKRVREFGFLQSELDRAKAGLLRGYESAFDEREKWESGQYVSEYVSNYLSNEPTPGIEWEFQQIQRLLPTIGLQELNALGREWITDRNRIVALSAPQKDGVHIPTEAEILATFRRADAGTVVAYSESVSDAPIVASAPPAGRIVQEKTVPSLGLTEWQLSNGIRVVLKPTDFKADEVLMQGWSPGGSSLTSNADLPSALLATTAVDRAGTGEFTEIELNKKLTGKQARAGAYIDETREGVSGRASPKDLSTMFELAYAKLTNPRRDSLAFAAFKAQVKPFFVNRDNDPEAVFSDTITVTMAQNHPRSAPMTADLLDRASYEKAFAIYQDRFADFSDYTFVIVGAFSLDSMRPLVTKWLATLPSTGRKESWKDVGAGLLRAKVEKTVRKGSEPKARTVLLYSGDATFGPKERHTMRSLSEYLEMRLLENLRESLGGTYSVSVSGSIDNIPRQTYQVAVQYGSAPDRVDALYKAVLAVVDSAKAGTIDEADVAKVREQQQRQLEVSMRENGYWMANLVARMENNEELTTLLAYPDMIKGLTATAIRDAARKYLDPERLARFTLLPMPPKS
jgi:zinc protease